MTNKALSIFNQLRPLSVGFDDVFDHFESMFDGPTLVGTNYPPYNIVKTGDNKFDIEVALAGFNKKDINVTSENGMLTIESKEDEKSKDKDGEVLHKGISKRYFKKSFTIADDVEIKGAELKDGMLRVSMEKIVPEAKKLKTIEIK
ncbi:heat-shock protein [Candidatus Woesearchaeota archaeon]|nr:heat-shock protein [Candidatus Woesearchaeota archaeon]